MKTGLDMNKPQDYLNLAPVNPGAEIGVSKLVSGHSAINAVFLCPKKHGKPVMGGLCGAAHAAPLLTSGTPTRTVPSTLIGVRWADLAILVRALNMQTSPSFTATAAHLCARDIQTIQRAIKIIEKSFIRQDAPDFIAPQIAATYARLLLGRLGHEEFIGLWLDSQNRLIASETISIGTINRADVWPREVAKSGLLNNAASVIFAHNHPSGDCTPSHPDISLTKKLSEILKLFEIKVLDHLVVSATNYLSMAEKGLIDE